MAKAKPKAQTIRECSKCNSSIVLNGKQYCRTMVKDISNPSECGRVESKIDCLYYRERKLLE